MCIAEFRIAAFGIDGNGGTVFFLPMAVLMCALWAMLGEARITVALQQIHRYFLQFQNDFLCAPALKEDGEGVSRMRIAAFRISAFGIDGNGGTVFFLPMALIMCVLFAFMPYISRKTDLFGISIPASEYNNPDIAALRRGYRNRSLLFNGLLSLLVAGLCGVQAPEVILSIAIFSQFVVFFVLYLTYHKKAKAYKAAQSWEEDVCSTIAVDLSPASRSFISPAWLLLNLPVIALTAMLGFQFYDAAPERLIRNWSLSGAPTGYMDKSYGVIGFIVFMQVMMTLLFTLIFFMVKNARRQYDSENPEESAHKLEIFRKSWAYFIVFAGTATNLVFTVSLLSMLEVISMGNAAFWMILFFIGIFTGAGLLTFFVGQGGSRIRVSTEKNTRIPMQDKDEYWKLGTIYFNPNDPAVFVEKRFGIGWTCNMARPLSWVCLIGLFVFIFASVYISGRMLG